jgi:AcrR family transcriptional regulator
MKRKPITEATRAAILRATWSLIAEKRRLDVSQSEIAAAAGVSRQTVYLAFGDRTGLLTAMARNKDEETDHVARLSEISRAGSAAPEDFLRYLGIWLDYLPLIYPVGILLDAASLTDPGARSAWDDRMKGALLAGLKRIVGHLAKGGHLASGWDAPGAAEFVWNLIHPASWRQLVVDCGWSADEFRRSRLQIVRSVVLKRGAHGGDKRGASPAPKRSVRSR